MKKNVARLGLSLYPGGRIGCRHPHHDEVIQPTYHCGDGLSASLAVLASRGFMKTLHLRSTFLAFPRPPPRRGWQRSEHCPQRFVPRITHQHVWGGHLDITGLELVPYLLIRHLFMDLMRCHVCTSCTSLVAT